MKPSLHRFLATGDLDANGLVDLFVLDNSLLKGYSNLDGSLRFQKFVGLLFVSNMFGPGDVDGDGKDDVAVQILVPPYVHFYSGATQAYLGGRPIVNFAVMSVAGDADGNGVSDFASCVVGSAATPGVAKVLNGQTGAVLLVVNGTAGDSFPVAAAASP
jgi:hypothetical protein